MEDITRKLIPNKNKKLWIPPNSSYIQQVMALSILGLILIERLQWK